MKDKVLVYTFALLFLFLRDTYAQVNLTQGLVAYYPFSGNTLDASGNNNNATNFGATLTTDQWGNPNSAYLFNGTSNYMSVANNATLQMSSVTLCARVKPNAFYGGPCFNNSIIDRGNGGYSSGSFSLIYTPTLNQNPGNYCTIPDPQHENYRINIRTSATASLNCVTPVNAIPYINTNQWDCVIGVYDIVTHVASIYVNGVFRYSFNYPNGMGGVNNSTMYIGGLANPSYPYYVNGVLDELRIYNRALNTQEIDSVCNYNPNIVLPVITAGFTGIKLESSDKLSWTTASEQNNAHFNIQHSFDGVSFSTIGKVNSKASSGNSASALSYSYMNNKPALGHNYYRLQQVDVDNKSSIHTQIIDLVRETNASNVSIYPNPAADIMNIDLYTTKAGQTTVKLLDMSGRVIRQIKVQPAVGMNNIKMGLGEIAAGFYTIQVYENNNLVYRNKISKSE